MSHKIIADECVDFRIIRKLREHQFEVISILEDCPSIPDKDVLTLAKTHNAILLTEDHHFGRWVFAHKHKGVGIIFLRYAPDDIQKIGFALIQVLNTYQDSLSRKFVVIKPKKIRVRDI